MAATDRASRLPADDAASCFHCGLPVPVGAHYPVAFEGRERVTCCPGCQAVARTIVDSGLCSYYHHRTQPAGAPGEPLIPDELRSLALFDQPELQRQFVNESADQARQVAARGRPDPRGHPLRRLAFGHHLGGTVAKPAEPLPARP